MTGTKTNGGATSAVATPAGAAPAVAGATADATAPARRTIAQRLASVERVRRRVEGGRLEELEDLVGELGERSPTWMPSRAGSRPSRSR